MDALIAEYGEGGALELICTRMANGESMKDIALSCGMTHGVMRKWLEDREERMVELALARRCFAESLVYEGLKEARDAGIETVGLGKFRAETYMKVAGKLDRVGWGDKDEKVVGGMGNITIVIGRVQVPELGVTIQGEGHEKVDSGDCVAGKPAGVGELSVG